MKKGLRWLSICACSMFMLFLFMVVSPPVVDCGWRDTVRKTKSRASRSYRQKKSSVKRSYQSKKKSFSKSYQRKKKSFSKGYQRKKKSVSRSYQQKKKDFSRGYQQKKRSVSRSYQQKKKNISRGYQRKKKDFRRSYQQKKQLAALRTQQARRNLDERIQKSRILGAEARQAAKRSISRLGVSGGHVVTSFLEKTKGRGAKAVEKAMPVMQRIKKKVRDPEVRKRAMTGALVAAGTAAAIYRHRDDIQYRLASEGMKRVKVPVNGEMKSVEDVYSDAILDKAPYLRGTAIAEDPAQMLAYGVTATAKKDLLNNMNVVPDGRGGLTSVNGAVINATGAEQGLAVLQVGDTMEGMAVEAASNGQLGHNAQVFSAAYSGASEKIVGGR